MCLKCKRRKSVHNHRHVTAGFVQFVLRMTAAVFVFFIFIENSRVTLYLQVLKVAAIGFIKGPHAYLRGLFPIMFAGVYGWIHMFLDAEMIACSCGYSAEADNDPQVQTIWGWGCQSRT